MEEGRKEIAKWAVSREELRAMLGDYYVTNNEHRKEGSDIVFDGPVSIFVPKEDHMAVWVRVDLPGVDPDNLAVIIKRDENTIEFKAIESSAARLTLLPPGGPPVRRTYHGQLRLDPTMFDVTRHLYSLVHGCLWFHIPSNKVVESKIGVKLEWGNRGGREGGENPFVVEGLEGMIVAESGEEFAADVPGVNNIRVEVSAEEGTKLVGEEKTEWVLGMALKGVKRVYVFMGDFEELMWEICEGILKVKKLV